jgi:hypothetical protein
MSGVADQVNRVQFISEDFDTYRSEADNFFQVNYPNDFNNLINTELGNALMDQLAFAMQSLSFMVNRRASELFLTTALLNKSVVKIARTLGYPIQSATPSSCDLTIVFPDAPYAIPIPIPTGFQFQGPGSIIYEYANSTPFVLNAGQSTITIPIREGQSRTVSLVSNGQANQIFSLYGITSGQYLYADSFLVTVDGVEWTREPLLLYESTNIYEVLFTDDPPKLNFGDSVVGNIPPTNANILVQFRFGLGLPGAIGSNQITAAVTPLVVNGQTIDMDFTNTVADVGSNPETIQHVQSFASSFFRTQNAAVIKSDYDTIAELQSGVALADAQIIRGIDEDITIQSNLSEIASGLGYMEKISSDLGVLGVSGIPALFIGGLAGLGVSGTQFLGWNGSSVSGTQFLGVSGAGALFIGGEPSLGVSGTSQAASDAVSGIFLVEGGVSGLTSYLSQAFSDTSKANQVQVIVLGVNSNNQYIAPSSLVLTNVQSVLQNLADAVVTVVAVDGSSRIVPTDITIELGLSSTAVQSDVQTAVYQALMQTTQPYGLLVLRNAGQNLYLYQIWNAIQAAVDVGDLVYTNIIINNPSNLLDANGNLIIDNQQIIQGRTVNVVTVEVFPPTTITQ